ncbi:MAG: alpha/beta fold hydrolase [bacterium]
MKKQIFLGWVVFSCLSLATLSASPQQVAHPKEVVKRAREFVTLLAQEDFETAVQGFDETMKNALPPQKLQDLWRSLQSQLGAFQHQGAVKATKVQQYDVIFVTCNFAKDSLNTKIAFDQNKQIAGLFFVPLQPPAKYTPPRYADQDKFLEREVAVGSGDWMLPGTLTLPKSNAASYPGIVLVHGSGPHDRDETIGPNKPFRDLAWGLATNGIAVLRYEKRTKAYAAKLAAIKDEITVRQETVEDALAAVTTLRQQKQIDPGKIFVLGHSLGGMLVPRIGLADSAIAGFVVMAGTTRPLEDLILEQTIYLFNLDGQLSESEKQQISELKKQVALIKSPALSPTTPSTELPLGVSANYWLDLRSYQPGKAAQQLHRPMLILQGGRDYQVTTEDFRLWQEALSSRNEVEFKLYPKLNHLFIGGDGKSTPAEYNRPGHVAETVIEDIANWIKTYHKR